MEDRSCHAPALIQCLAITVATRKRVWIRSGNECAYPGCNRELLTPTAAGGDDTIIGKECHIIAQRDHPSVARAPCVYSLKMRRSNGLT